MDRIREYLIGVIVAALLCGIVSVLTDPKGSVGHALKLICGLLMLLAVVRPWLNISLNSLYQWPDSIIADGNDWMVSGHTMAEDAYRASIKQQTQAYILDEARTLGCDLTAEVRLSDEDIPVPTQVILSGSVSPYAKEALTNLLTQQLGIEREDLLWT